MTIKEKMERVNEIVENMHKYGAKGVDVEINIDAKTPDTKFSVIPNAPIKDRRKYLGDGIAEQSRARIQYKIKDNAKRAYEAAEAGDVYRNIVETAEVMGHAISLRELGYAVDTVQYTKDVGSVWGTMRVPCIIRINGEEIYSLPTKEETQEQREKEIEEIKEQCMEDFELFEAEGADVVEEFVGRLVLRCENLARLCEERRWYTLGSTEQRAKMIRKIESRTDVTLADVTRAAKNIYVHSSGDTLEEIFETLLQSLKAYRVSLKLHV
nr:MAG TPA: hypothetical protein [Caudoviricetes sp.]